MGKKTGTFLAPVFDCYQCLFFYSLHCSLYFCSHTGDLFKRYCANGNTYTCSQRNSKNIVFVQFITDSIGIFCRNGQEEACYIRQHRQAAFFGFFCEQVGTCFDHLIIIVTLFFGSGKQFRVTVNISQSFHCRTVDVGRGRTRMFGKGLRHAVRIAFWVLAILQIIDVLPVIVDWMRACQLPIGTDKLTVWALIVGFLTLFLALGIASRISGLCEAAIMNMREMEMNSRVVLARLCRVGFLILGVLVGLSSAGIDLTVLSVFGGALGVGIGFGMQKIASNYISGFIILCDKSIKIGDMVNAAGFTGIITQINTRYSVLRNTSGEEMIVPNENFVTGSVMNYSHTDTATLVTLDVSCAYESNVDEALRILSECVLAQPRVLHDPGHKPWFAVTEFAASGINLRAAFWIADPRDGTVVLKSNIFRAVLKAYNEAGIEIPYDKLEVTLKGTGATEEAPAA